MGSEKAPTKSHKYPQKQKAPYLHKGVNKNVLEPI